MPNVFDPRWDADQQQPPFRWRRARVERQAGSQQLGASLYDLPAGASSWPLVVSTMLAPELNEYPESGKLWGLSFAPGAERGRDEVEVLARPEDNLDYLEGER